MKRGVWARSARVIGLTAAIMLGAADAAADAITGDLFYTRNTGTPNINTVSYSYDGATTFTLGTPTPITTTPGADGITGNPQNSNLLIVGNGSNNISTVNVSTGAVTTISSPVASFHLEVPTANVVLTAGIPGSLARHDILGDGSLSGGTVISLSGTDTTVTQIITTPSGFFYTNSGPGGTGSFGTLGFNTGNPETATSATTSSLLTSLPAAHGGTYDPFTNTIIIMGEEHITQLDLAGTILADITVPGSIFDQGTVDGLGHLFAASNTGTLSFIDYSASGLIDGSSFLATVFLASNLDDIAPLTGPGSTETVKLYEPAPFALFGAGLAVLGLARRRRAGRSR